MLERLGVVKSIWNKKAPHFSSYASSKHGFQCLYKIYHSVNAKRGAVRKFPNILALKEVY